MHEIALEAERASANPYIDVEVIAQFAGPGGIVKDVRGFWDGGRTFKVRFTPTAQGEWTYTITSKPADAGLTAEGAFTVTAPAAGSHGFLRRDTEFPTGFVFDDGTRFFMVGTTYYDILLNARAGNAWKESVANITRYGVNKVRMNLHPGDGGGKSHYPASKPFVSGDPERPDLAHWQTADRGPSRFISRLGPTGILRTRRGRRMPSSSSASATAARRSRSAMNGRRRPKVRRDSPLATIGAITRSSPTGLERTRS